jgi:hypothetical protein
MDWEQSLEKVPTNSLLISTPANTLIRFYCPIQAICIMQVAGYEVGDSVFIQGIYQRKNSQLLYLIDGLKYPHQHFQITL